MVEQRTFTQGRGLPLTLRAAFAVCIGVRSASQPLQALCSRGRGGSFPEVAVRRFLGSLLPPSPRALWGLLLLLGATRNPQVGSHHTVAGGERLIINPSEARGHGPRSTSSADGPFPSARWRGLAVGGISGAVDQIETVSVANRLTYYCSEVYFGESVNN